MKCFLYLSIFLIPFYFVRFKIFGIPTNILEISILITFFLYLFEHITSRKKIELLNLDWAIIVFLLLALIVALFSPDKIAALGIFKGWFLIPALLYFVAKESFITKDIYKLSIPLFLSLLLVSVWAILQKYGIISTLFYQKGDPNFDQYLGSNLRLFGPFESPNFLAMFIVPVLFLSLPLVDRTKNTLSKIILMILMLFPVYVLYFTKSRGGLFAFAAALLVFALAYILYKYKMYRSANAKGIIAFLVAILAFFAYKIGFSPSKDYSREQIYKYSWEMIKSHPVFGIGLGDFQNRIDALSASNEQFRAYVLSYALHPHNLYLALWLYLGIPGLIVFLVIIWQFLSRAFSSLGSKIAIFPLAAMTAILAHGLVDTTYFKNDLSAIFFLTLAFAVIIKEGQKKETQNAE